ncbi:hypothetical protein GCM10022248_16590 [Nonomuraea soli]
MQPLTPQTTTRAAITLARISDILPSLMAGAAPDWHVHDPAAPPECCLRYLPGGIPDSRLKANSEEHRHMESSSQLGRIVVAVRH